MIWGTIIFGNTHIYICYTPWMAGTPSMPLVEASPSQRPGTAQLGRVESSPVYAPFQQQKYAKRWQHLKGQNRAKNPANKKRGRCHPNLVIPIFFPKKGWLNTKGTYQFLTCWKVGTIHWVQSVQSSHLSGLPGENFENPTILTYSSLKH